MPNNAGPAEITANEALEAASEEVLEATYRRLLGEDGSIDNAVNTPTGCLLTQKSANRSGPTGYPIIQLVSVIKRARSANGTVQPRQPAVLAHRLVAYLHAK